MALIVYITHINVDFGARRLIGAECERVGIARPLIVADAGVRVGCTSTTATGSGGGAPPGPPGGPPWT